MFDHESGNIGLVPASLALNYVTGTMELLGHKVKRMSLLNEVIAVAVAFSPARGTRHMLPSSMFFLLHQGMRASFQADTQPYFSASTSRADSTLHVPVPSALENS